MKVLKLATAGSVDDGKSTLIGRLLYDTKSLTDDKLEAIRASSKRKGFDYLDFSLATDGLVAEREQGITIDVAHIYFSTNKKSYIIADTPGHVEYTRNMVTGASTSQASIILVDARHGVTEQTYRHFFINNLLRLKHVIIAVNKMDLVAYDEAKFNQIKNDIIALSKKSYYQDQSITFVPVSALMGENVVTSSTEMNWYKGETLLYYLEELEDQDLFEKGMARFPVQTVIRPKKEEFHDFRGYAGKLYGNTLKVNDEVTILPSLTTSKIKDIYFFDKAYDEAQRGSSINITLTDDVNVTRGNMIVKNNELPKNSKEIDAIVCWMDAKPLSVGGKYFIQHNVNTVLSKISQLKSRIKTDFSGEETNISQLKLNEIGRIQLKLNKPIFYDAYAENKFNGAFIIIDSQTNFTAGIGFIQ